MTDQPAHRLDCRFRDLVRRLGGRPGPARGGVGALRARRLPLLGVRAVLALVAMLTWFTAISWMSLADAVALSFTSPLFATVAAVCCFRGPIDPRTCREIRALSASEWVRGPARLCLGVRTDGACGSVVDG